MTPIAAFSPDAQGIVEERCSKALAGNIDLLSHGEPMVNVVDRRLRGLDESAIPPQCRR
jgi:hypothetical protein